MSSVWAQTVDLDQSSEAIYEQLFGVKLHFMQVFFAVDAVDVSIELCKKHYNKNELAINASAQQWVARNNIDEVRSVLNEYYLIAGQAQIDEREGMHQGLRADLESSVNTQAKAVCEELPSFLDSAESFNAEQIASTALLKAFNQKHRLTAEVTTQPLSAVENPRYQSLKERGHNARYTVIPTEFACYANKAYDAYEKADFILQTAIDGSYQSSIGSGRYKSDLDADETQTSKLKWTGALAQYSSSRIYFNKHGQTIRFRSLIIADKVLDYDCYQQGARLDAALIRFRLNDPQQDRYTCHANDGEELPALVLLNDRRYSVDKKEGRYRVDLRSSTSYAMLDFNEGPLKGSKARYYEEEGNGFRIINFKELKGYLPAVAASSSVTMRCSSVGDPVNLQHYGDEPSLKPVKGSGGLKGLYAVKKYSDPSHRSNYNFYYFTSKGHVYMGEPDTALDDIDCTKTLPNGAPLCANYAITGADIKITADYKNIDDLKKSNLIKIKTKYKKLKGKFWSNAGSTIGICSFNCTSWYDESIITFDKKGRFQEQTSGQAIANSSIGGMSTSASGFNYGDKSGNYKIINNTIELRYKNGRIVKHFIAFFKADAFQMNGWSYSPKPDD